MASTVYEADNCAFDSGKRGPGNETLKKRKEQTAFYDRFKPSAGPGNYIVLLKLTAKFVL